MSPRHLLPASSNGYHSTGEDRGVTAMSKGAGDRLNTGARKPPAWVQIDYPAAFKMPVAEAAERSGWRLRMENGREMVRPEESYLHTRPRLIEGERIPPDDLAGASLGTSEHWGRTSDLLGEFAPLAPRLREQMVQATTTEAYLASFRNLLSVTPEASLAADIGTGWDRILNEMPAASLWRVPINSRMATRVSLINGLFAYFETPELFAGPSPEATSFEAGRGFLGRYVYGLEFLLDPFLLSTSPSALGWAASRLGGAYVVLFGEARSYLSAEAGPSLLDLYKPLAMPSWILRPKLDLPSLSAEQIRRAFLWWILQVDQQLSLLLDPRRYTDAKGRHDPAVQVSVMLSAARLFVTVQAILAEPLESHSRLGFLFDALDLLEGMRLGGYDVLCSASRARQALAVIREKLPEPVATVLLPKCEGAIDALDSVGKEFFCEARIGGGKMRLPGKNGEIEISLDAAGAQYLRLVRNSTHSLHAMATTDHVDRTLYACHSGSFDNRLPDLAFLHLMRLMADPSLVLGPARHS